MKIGIRSMVNAFDKARRGEPSGRGGPTVPVPIGLIEDALLVLRPLADKDDRDELARQGRLCRFCKQREVPDRRRTCGHGDCQHAHLEEAKARVAEHVAKNAAVLPSRSTEPKE